MITIKFQADMYLFAPKRQKELNLPFTEPRSLQEILATIGLTGEEIGFIVVNDNFLRMNEDNDYLINDNSIIELYPFIGGG